MTWQLCREMSALSFQGALQLLGMSQAGAARYLNLSERQVYRMIHGIVPVPVPISLLLHALVAHDEYPIVPKRTKKPQPLDEPPNPVSLP